MTYTSTWTDADEQGDLVAGLHWVRDDHLAELASALNRRRRLTYQADRDYSAQIAAGAYVRAALLAGALPSPLENLRAQVADLLGPALGGMGGQPPSPAGMEWLWPLADDDENAVLVLTQPQAGQVALLEKIGQDGSWSDPALGGGVTPIRACHVNQLRRASELLRRGRWTLPLYLTSGMFSTAPQTPWIGGYVANNGSAEIRSVGCIIARTDDSPALGLSGVEARPASRIELTAQNDCSVELRRILRPMALLSDPPTWNCYRPAQSLAWASPGGCGQNDSEAIGSVALLAGQAGVLTGTGVAAALQAMIDGAGQNFLLRRTDTGYTSIPVSARTVVEFDLVSPPN
jgi:hypothetical protein